MKSNMRSSPSDEAGSGGAACHHAATEHAVMHAAAAHGMCGLIAAFTMMTAAQVDKGAGWSHMSGSSELCQLDKLAPS